MERFTSAKPSTDVAPPQWGATQQVRRRDHQSDELAGQCRRWGEAKGVGTIRTSMPSRTCRRRIVGSPTPWAGVIERSMLFEAAAAMCRGTSGMET